VCTEKDRGVLPIAHHDLLHSLVAPATIGSQPRRRIAAGEVTVGLINPTPSRYKPNS
jgi:hypothetical protein